MSDTQTKNMSDHHTTNHYAKFDDGYWSLQCEAPANSFCHAIYNCNCELYLDFHINDDGKPEHMSEDEEWHTGKFKPSWCIYRDWFDHSEDLEGTIRVPINPEWDGGCYRFHILKSDQ